MRRRPPSLHPSPLRLAPPPLPAEATGKAANGGYRSRNNRLFAALFVACVSVPAFLAGLSHFRLLEETAASSSSVPSFLSASLRRFRQRQRDGGGEDRERRQQQQQQTAKSAAEWTAAAAGSGVNGTSNYTTTRYRLPPYETIVDEHGDVVGSPQILLQFAIVGFGKCGTTTVMEWLRTSPELQLLKSEVWALPQGQLSRLLSRLYRKLTAPDRKRGYKCPGDILSNNAVRYYQQWFPETQMIVGIRHPVLWFESLYNFRVQNYKTFRRHPNDLIGACRKHDKFTCTRRGFFAYYLMRLGKQFLSYDEDDEGSGNDGVVSGTGDDRSRQGPQAKRGGKRIIRKVRKFTNLEKKISRYYGEPYELDIRDDILDMTSNEVFLFDVDQLSDTDPLRRELFRQDLQNFLQLSEPLPPNPVPIKPGKFHHNITVQADKNQRKIDICDDEYVPLRRELMELASMSSEWIREQFLGRPGVYVSSPEYLRRILEERWLVDPCDDENNRLGSNNTLASVTNNNETIALAPRAALAVTSQSGRLPLSRIVDGYGRIVGDPQSLLDFSIIGFGKCGTTTLLKWLGSSNETACLPGESYSLMHHDPGRLVESLYEELPADVINGTRYRRCYKCPLDITQWHILDYYRTLFPRTKLVVGVRHPVLWFQSLYNFRVQTRSDYEDLIHPNQMIGLCFKRNKMICTRKGNFAHFLMRLGKQNYNGHRPFTDLERKIANHYKKETFEYTDAAYMPNEVFLYELGQLGDDESARKRNFTKSIQSFLGLRHDLDVAVIHQVSPGVAWNSTEEQQKRDRKKIDICNDDYLRVRTELMTLARMSSEWIRTVFLNLPDVHAANRDHLNALLLTWMDDPCDNRNGGTLEISRN